MNSSHNYNTEKLYDLIDVIGFLWKGKLVIVSCILVTLIFSVGVYFQRSDSKYTTAVPLTVIDLEKSEPRDVAAKINRFFGTTEARSLIQSYGSSHGESNSLGLTVKEQKGRLFLNVVANDSDPSGNRAMDLAEKISNLIEKANEAKRNSLTNSSMTVSISGEDDLQKIFALQVKEEGPLLIEIYKLESELLSRFKLESSSTLAVQTTEVGGEVLRILSRSDIQISPEDKALILEKSSHLIGQVLAVRAKYSRAISSLSDSIARSVELKLLDKNPLPEFEPDIGEYLAMKSKWQHEISESKFALYGWLGLFLGFLFGVFIYGTTTYFHSQWPRLKQILK